MKRSIYAWACALPLLATPAVAQEPDQGFSLDKLEFAGDFRLRAEFNDLSDSKNRNSTHVDLGDVMNTEMFTLDRLFVTYKPNDIDDLTVDAGKFALRMQRNPVYGELVWDKDVQPEGVQLNWGDSDLGINFGEFQLIHQSKSNDSWMTHLQGYANFDMGEASRIKTSLGFTYVGDPNPGASTVIPDGDNPGNLNAETPGGQYLSDFGILDAVVSAELGQLTLAGELIMNLRADETVGDTGFGIGASYKTDGGSKAYYQYQLIEQDAVFTAIAGDDDILPSNSSSHIIGYKIPTAEWSNINIWAIASEWDEVPVGSTDDWVFRFRIDWNIEF
jgi:hypothetical protein